MKIRNLMHGNSCKIQPSPLISAFFIVACRNYLIVVSKNGVYTQRRVAGMHICIYRVPWKVFGSRALRSKFVTVSQKNSRDIKAELGSIYFRDYIPNILHNVFHRSWWPFASNLIDCSRCIARERSCKNEGMT